MITSMFQRNILIPRQDYSARHRQQNTDGASNFSNKKTNITYDPFVAENCTIQPAQGDDLQTLDEGLRNREVLVIITDTPLTPGREGSNVLADQIEYEGVDGISWYTVVKVKKHDAGVINHWRAVIVREPK